MLGQQAVKDAVHLHHAVVFPQVVLRLGQEDVALAVASQQGHLWQKLKLSAVLPRVRGVKELDIMFLVSVSDACFTK